MQQLLCRYKGHSCITVIGKYTRRMCVWCSLLVMQHRSTGVLHAQYAWYLPLSYIYFSAGRRGGGCGGARVLLVGCAHAALVAPALAVLLLAGTQRSEVHYALVQGSVLLSSFIVNT